jgi:RNase P protein component
MLVTHPPCDVVVRATPAAYGVPITTLAADLAQAMRRLGTTPPAT